MFAERFDSITGVDISPKMILLARENAEKRGLSNVEFQVMDASMLHFADGTYDFVNCVTVLQHILNDENWKKAIREIARVTKPGGFVLLFEMAPNLAIRKRTTHLSIRTMRQYVEEFGKAGARLVYWRAADLSLPVTVVGLKSYAASFNKRVYYFMSGRRIGSTGLLSFLSWVAAMLAEVIDYRLAETPLSFLSVGRILLFQRKTRLARSQTRVQSGLA